MKIFYIILAAITSEIVFLVGFLLIYLIVRLLHFPYAVLHLKNRYRWMSDGVLAGCGAIFLASYVSLLITRPQDLSEFSAILTAIVLPVIGEIGYYRYLTKKIKTRFVGRLHLALKAFAVRGEFASNFYLLSERMTLENRGEQLTNQQAIEHLKREAYERTQGYLFYLLLWSLVGYVIGIFLVHKFLFSHGNIIH